MNVDTAQGLAMNQEDKLFLSIVFVTITIVYFAIKLGV